MKNKKIIISFIIIFVIFNIIMCNINLCNAQSLSQQLNGMVNNKSGGYVLPSWIATVLKVILAGFQVGITGYWVVTFTLQGIRYFSTAAAGGRGKQDAAARIRLRNTFFFGVLWFLFAGLLNALYGI